MSACHLCPPLPVKPRGLELRSPSYSQHLGPQGLRSARPNALDAVLLYTATRGQQSAALGSPWAAGEVLGAELGFLGMGNRKARLGEAAGTGEWGWKSPRSRLRSKEVISSCHFTHPSMYSFSH